MRNTDNTQKKLFQYLLSFCAINGEPSASVNDDAVFVKAGHRTIAIQGGLVITIKKPFSAGFHAPVVLDEPADQRHILLVVAHVRALHKAGRIAAETYSETRMDRPVTHRAADGWLLEAAHRQTDSNFKRFVLVRGHVISANLANFVDKHDQAEV